jgi:hypothetical protein
MRWYQRTHHERLSAAPTIGIRSERVDQGHRATLVFVSSDRQLVTAEQLDAMSPNERAAVLTEHLVTDLAELPEAFRERVLATGRRLATERTQAAAE